MHAQKESPLNVLTKHRRKGRNLKNKTKYPLPHTHTHIHKKPDQVPKEFRRPDRARERRVSLQAHRLVAGAWGSEHPAGASPATRAVTPPSPAPLACAPAAPRRRDGERTPETSTGLRLAAGHPPQAAGSCAPRGGERARPTKQERKSRARSPPPNKGSVPRRGPAWETPAKAKVPRHADPPASGLPPAPTHSPGRAASVADFPRQPSPSLDLGLSIDSCSCAVPACGHIGDGRKCALDPPSRRTAPRAAALPLASNLMPARAEVGT